MRRSSLLLIAILAYPTVATMARCEEGFAGSPPWWYLGPLDHYVPETAKPAPPMPLPNLGGLPPVNLTPSGPIEIPLPAGIGFGESLLIPLGPEEPPIWFDGPPASLIFLQSRTMEAASPQVIELHDNAPADYGNPPYDLIATPKPPRPIRFDE